jgi:hypothetical protein
MRKWSVPLLLLLLLVPAVQSNQELSVDLTLTWDKMVTFNGPTYRYGVELVDWDRCDEVYWDGHRCIFTAGIRILQIDKSEIKWKKEYLHLKYGETEINQKFGDIIITKVTIDKIAFNDGYVDLTIFYEHRYTIDEKPKYERMITQEETVIHLGDTQNVYSLYLSSFGDQVFYVFSLNGEKQTEEGTSILPDEQVTLWLNLSIDLIKVNSTKILRIYAPSRMHMLTTEQFSLEEKDIVTINGKDFSVSENTLSIGGEEYPIEENTFIVTRIGWVIFHEGTVTLYAETIEITEHDPDLRLTYDAPSLLLGEARSLPITLTNTGKGLADVVFRVYGMGADQTWDGSLAYNESTEIAVSIAPETIYDTLTIELNGEKTTVPITVEQPQPSSIPPSPTTAPTPTETPVPTQVHSSTPEKKPLTIVIVLISLTFLAIYGQNEPKKVSSKKEKDMPPKEEPDKKKERGLPTKPLKYLNKRI